MLTEVNYVDGGGGNAFTYFSQTYSSGTSIPCGFSPNKAWVYLSLDSNTRNAMFEIDFTTNTMVLNYILNGSFHRDNINSLNYNNGYFVASRSGNNVTFTSNSGYFNSGIIDMVAWT